MAAAAAGAGRAAARRHGPLATAPPATRDTPRLPAPAALPRPAPCSEISARRKSQVGTGSRSEKIKTYNYKDTRMSGGCTRGMGGAAGERVRLAPGAPAKAGAARGARPRGHARERRGAVVAWAGGGGGWSNRRLVELASSPRRGGAGLEAPR